MESPSERAVLLYSLQHWLRGDHLWSDEPACHRLPLNSETELLLHDLHPTREQVDELLVLIQRMAATDPDRVTAGEAPDASSSSGSWKTQSDTSGPLIAESSGGLLDVKLNYDTDLGDWPPEAERLAATHMTPPEQARARHYHSQVKHRTAYGAKRMAQQ
ncbi:hypothetical protein KEM52_003368 [Ascosphaera acerosa]|nr:hypothetical protein KEM52_003368 [Ascosphaera acerosa]